MKIPVYFTPVSASSPAHARVEALRRLLAESKVLACVDKGDGAVIKMHFGEEGNTGYVAPEYIGCISRLLAEKTSDITVSDANTLYKGKRTLSADHEKLALDHGFTQERTGARLAVPDERGADACVTVETRGKYIKKATILRLYAEAKALVGVAHFKGHLMTGFGGALKNIGMGCASREGKLAQHSSVCPVVRVKKCVGCGACEAACPVDAVAVVDGKAKITPSKCIGCASCIAACAYGAMDVNWGAGSDTIMERMVEYVAATLAGRKKAAYVNFALKITAECDCLAKDDPRIVDDVGIFASADPVALDQACFDLVKEKAGGADVFKQAHPERDGLRQLAYAEKIGIGTRTYELVRVTPSAG
jgi:uncharacterized protein